MKTTTRSAMLPLTAIICLVLAQVGEADIYEFDGDLIAYWKLDQMDGGTSTPEEIGPYTTSVDTNNGVVTVISTGRVDNAFEFDGLWYDHVKTDGTVPVGSSFSVSAWVRVDGSMGGKYRRIVENNFADSFLLGTHGPSGKYMWSVNGPLPNTGPAVGVPLTNWVHVAGTYDGGTTTAILYVNNSPTTMNTGTTAPSPTNLPVRIGCAAPGDASTWPGAIDEVRIYNRALTAGEIDDLYNNIGLVAPGGAAGTVVIVK